MNLLSGKDDLEVNELNDGRPRLREESLITRRRVVIKVSRQETK